MKVIASDGETRSRNGNESATKPYGHPIAGYSQMASMMARYVTSWPEIFSRDLDYTTRFWRKFMLWLIEKKIEHLTEKNL